ncbi:unnamed protein product [Lactuca virosa]|uniref:Secreted protein n=1 Tax=Lactuca virosa TaxID=75947 RepID=A0AAU9MN24_9ASTR|nr:unnamed protein product [Lactuca virosa]
MGSKLVLPFLCPHLVLQISLSPSTQFVTVVTASGLIVDVTGPWREPDSTVVAEVGRFSVEVREFQGMSRGIGYEKMRKRHKQQQQQEYQ